MSRTASPWIEFPAFRDYEAGRQAANNAMMALLAGSQLAAHTLQLTRGSTRLLPEIFPGVEHVSYFNLRTDVATDLLLDTGHHLGAVAVPYALAVHEDFVVTVLDILDSLGFSRRAPGRNADTTKNRVKAWNMHEAVWMTLGQAAPSRGSIPALEHFHLLREMRNAQIHAGGVVTPELAAEATNMTSQAAINWQRLARRTPEDVVADRRFKFTTFDIFAVFATTKAMGRIVNGILKSHIHVGHWADICLQDYVAQTSKPVGSDQWLRGLIGHAALNYAASGVSPEDVITAAVAAGAWTEGRTYAPRRSVRGAKRRRDRGTRPPEP
jgi:hypothetical protein